MNATTRVYQSALGISTGDIITTSYNTGPYEVWSIWGPAYVMRMIGGLFVRDYPVISLSLVDAVQPERGQRQFYAINEIHQEGDRWISGDDEVFVEKRAARGIQADLFATDAQPHPYPFDPAVDYYGDVPAWNCQRCALDFNAPPRKGPPHSYPPMCPRCNLAADRIFILTREGKS